MAPTTGRRDKYADAINARLQPRGGVFQFFVISRNCSQINFIAARILVFGSFDLLFFVGFLPCLSYR
jgi:hypothetical protein